MLIEIEKKKTTEATDTPERVVTKERLPDERKGVTHHFSVTDRDGKTVDGYITVGMFEDGRPGELFIKVGKSGGEGAVWDWGAKMFSAALQYGAPLENLCAKMINTKYDPYGNTNNPEIPRCSSIEDYVARYCLDRFGTPPEEQ